MRMLLLITIAIWLAFIAGQELAHADTCNQHVYDQVYKAIIMQALDGDLSPESFDVRNDTIENLRRLCNGQMSTYEMGIIEKANNIALRSTHHD